MNIFEKSKPNKPTRFSEFIRNAPSKEKKRVYNDVLKKATEDQNATLKMARRK